MKLFKVKDYMKMENPDPGKAYRPEILTREDAAKALGGIFGVLVPGSQVPYHYHEERESIILAISGEATEVVEGRGFPVAAGDILYIPAGEKHMTVNDSEKEFRYLEFFTSPPVAADFVEIGAFSVSKE
jgi:quercetin dioxygenase-like cupin family protein